MRNERGSGSDGRRSGGRIRLAASAALLAVSAVTIGAITDYIPT